MKTVFLFTALVVQLVVSRLALGQTDVAHAPSTAYFQVVDQYGDSVPEAKVMITKLSQSAEWHGRSGRGPQKFESDKHGFFTVDMTEALLDVEDASKDGFVFEKRLNRHLNWLVLRPNSPDRPHRVVLRKKEREREFVLTFQHDDRHSFKKGEKKSPLRIRVLAKPPQADVFILPQFDEMKNQWCVNLWTTNEANGIIATTNRVFSAPETGYRKRIIVDQECFTNESFTIYLKVHEPDCFVMLGFDPFVIEAHNYEDNVWCEIHYIHFVLNPFGGRTFESIDVDKSVAWGYGEISKNCVKYLLEGRRPPYPDLPAWDKNIKRRRALMDAESDWENKYCYARRKEKARIEDEMRKKGKTEREIQAAVKSLEQEIKEGYAQAEKCQEEIDSLKAEFPTLYLPETPVKSSQSKAASIQSKPRVNVPK